MPLPWTGGLGQPPSPRLRWASSYADYGYALAGLVVPIISLPLTGLLPAFAVTAWREQWWTRGERLAYSTLAVFAIAFMTFLNYWKLLGIRY
jgi:hypothetical protein